MVSSWLWCMISSLAGLPTKVRMKQYRIWQFVCRAEALSHMQQKVGKRHFLFLVFLPKPLDCFTFHTELRKEVCLEMTQGGRGSDSFTELKQYWHFLRVLASICAGRSLLEEKNSKPLHVPRTKEEKNAKQVRFAQEETSRPESSGQEMRWPGRKHESKKERNTKEEETKE